jgi:hypothetical protein
MNIQLFNFLEDNKTEILKQLTDWINRERPAYNEMSDSSLQVLLDRLLDSYLDLLVTGQTDSLDQLFRALSRVLAVRGSKFSDVFELPLMMAAVIRRQLTEEYSNLSGEEAVEKLNQALDVTEAIAHQTACRFLDVFQEQLKKRIDDHNNYLARTQQEFGVDLSSFRIEPEA